MIDASGRPDEVTEESGYVMMENESGEFEVLDDEADEPRPSGRALGTPSGRSREVGWSPAVARSTFATSEPSLMSVSKELGRNPRGATPAALAARALGRSAPSSSAPVRATPSSPAPRAVGIAGASTAPPAARAAAATPVPAPTPMASPKPSMTPPPPPPPMRAPVAPVAPAPKLAARAAPAPAVEASELDPNISAKLIGAFTGSFLITTAIVLGLWFTIGPDTRLGARPPAAAPIAAAPAAAPVAAPVAAPPADPTAEAVPPEEEIAPVEVAPPTGPATRSPQAGRSSKVEPEPVVAEPVVHSAGNQTGTSDISVYAPPPVRSRADLIDEEPAAVLPPPPFTTAPLEVKRPDPLPADISKLQGTYGGKAAGRTAEITLEFLPDGKVQGVVKYTDGTVAALSAPGTYSMLVDGSASVALVEKGTGTFYSGVVKDGVYEGMVTAGGKSKGRFRVER